MAKDWMDSAPKFVGSFNKLSQIPGDAFAEVAFVGRSNVGKSSLINAITGVKGLAKTSSTPGRTQSLNFFNWADRMYVVDLPGYGYAKAPRDLVKSWQGMMKDYLRGRASLRRVFLLIDSRHGIKDNDVEMMKMLDECAMNYQIVLTKADKIKESALKKVYEAGMEYQKDHPAMYPEILKTSSEKGIGLKEIRLEILSLK